MKAANFSLTLTLSRWEREQPLVRFLKLASFEAESIFRLAMNPWRRFRKGEERFSLSLGRGPV